MGVAPSAMSPSAAPLAIMKTSPIPPFCSHVGQSMPMQSIIDTDVSATNVGCSTAVPMTVFFFSVIGASHRLAISRIIQSEDVAHLQGLTNYEIDLYEPHTEADRERQYQRETGRFRSRPRRGTTAWVEFKCNWARQRT